MNRINLENRRAIVASGARGSLWDTDKDAVNEAADTLGAPANAVNSDYWETLNANA